MIKKIDHLNIKEVADSGQCFRWKEISENEFFVTAYGKCLHIKQLADDSLFEIDCDEEEWDSIFSHYLDLETDYNHIEELIINSGDEHLKEAFALGKGIRILNQDLWEMIVSYLISQNNNISRIKRSIQLICEKAGKKIILKTGSGVYENYIFPGPFDVEKGFFDDKLLGLGYRVEYLEEIYEFARNNPSWVESLKGLSYEDARNELLKRKGVGPKVADCISLFGLHHIEAFPIDTHVKQLLNTYYKEGFPYEYFNGVAGIIQQYLFYYELQKNRKK